MVTLAVLQPGYLPWLGYFDQMIRADVFLHYDTAQFDKNSWRNRNRILTANGVQWLTVPVSVRLGDRIRDVTIASGTAWARKHTATISQSYAKAACRDAYLADLEAILARPWRHLIDLNLALVDAFLDWFGIRCRHGLVSDYDVEGSQTEKLVNLCRAVGADRYLSGDAAADYLDTECFRQHGIAVEWQRYRHPRYPQCRWTGSTGAEPEFVPYLSALDLLMNCGPEGGKILHDTARRARQTAGEGSSDVVQPLRAMCPKTRDR